MTDMTERRQAKLGWIVGWHGGFIWVVILSIVFLVQGRIVQAVTGIAIAGLASAAIVLLSPWRYPQTSFRRLMLPIYALFLCALAWATWSFGDLRQLGISSWWSAFILLPMLAPLWTVGRHRWGDGED